MDIALKMSINDYFSSNGFSARELTKNDTHEIQDFIWECLDYYIDVLGAEPRVDEANRIFDDIEQEYSGEGKTLNQNQVIGIFSEQKELVSVIQICEWKELIKDFDIKTFLISPDFRKDGLGSILCEKLVKFLEAQDARTIFTKINVHNEEGQRFLINNGFTLHYTGVEDKLNLGDSISLYNIMKKILKRSLYVK